VLAAQRGARVSGLDAAEGLIEIARQRNPSADFRVGDMQNLPFGDGEFDVVCAANSVQYAADHVAALRELKRVCVLEGRVTAGLFGPAENVAFRVIQAAVRNVLPTAPSGKGPYELSAPGVLEGACEESGLRVLESREVDCPYVYPDFETYWRGNAWAGPFQAALRAIGEDRLRAATRQAIEAFRIDDGSICIGPNMFKYVVAAA
jgi:SAM-dependent methyltransferase